MRHEEFREEALAATSRVALVEAFERALAHDVSFEKVRPELRRTGKLFGGIVRDLRRRGPHWVDDWRAGLRVKVLASVLFMFFACLAPAVAFGGLLATLTGGQIGAVEALLASAICGVIWSLFAGQPLAIVGATGPNVIFTGILYVACERLDAPFLPTLAWTGLWAGLFLVTLAALDASSLIRYFTRFSDEIFAALIAMIFVSEALADMLGPFRDGPSSEDGAHLSLLIALGTFGLAISMSRLRRSSYLLPKVREFLSDFGPAIALALMSLAAWRLGGASLETLAVPDHFAPTADRGWLVNPLDAPTWVIGASVLPALLLTLLIWMNQNITARLIDSPDHKLTKGPAFHWDIAVMGALVALMSLFGLPWVVGAVVRSLNHVKSLAVTDGDRVLGTVENRLSNLVIHVLLGIACVLLLPLLAYVPMAVLFGMFLFMGVGTLGGNQMVERLRLWVLDPERYPAVHYLHAVPGKRVHFFTAIQVACLGGLWAVKASAIGILFPFFLALLVPVRMLLARVFAPEHLALLDAEEVPADEEYREFGV
ncbi:MAG: HCO3- transporter [Sandaracinaceae bacterium]|nr:HCO3- transporter [Sandaracinaceae bacterium]